MKLRPKNPRLIIRDDDVSYFTDQRHLEYLYKDIWYKIPICLSIVPFIYAGQAEVPVGKVDNQYHSIGKNKKLVKYIQKKQKEGKVRVWQHGMTHEDVLGEFECEQRHPLHYYRNAKRHLEKHFGEVKVFVAPHDRFSHNAIKHVEKLGMDICRGFAPLPREWSKGYFKNLFKLFQMWALNKISPEPLYRPIQPLKYPNHRELYSYRINHITYENIDKIIERHRKGILCITVHNRTLDMEGIDKIKYIMERLK